MLLEKYTFLSNQSIRHLNLTLYEYGYNFIGTVHLLTTTLRFNLIQSMTIIIESIKFVVYRHGENYLL